MDTASETHLPIAQLSPDVDTSTKSITGVVTIVWPYSSIKRALSILLVEPDFRLRQRKGQVRVTFRGPTAQDVVGSGLASGDTVKIHLEGAKIIENAFQSGTPGRAVDYELSYGKRLRFERTDVSGKSTAVNVDRASSPEPEDASLLPQTLVTEAWTPRFKTQFRNLEPNKKWASPAFIKRVSLPPTSLFAENGLDEHDDWLEGRTSKRTKFGRGSGQWRFVERSPSPEKEASIQDIVQDEVMGGSLSPAEVQVQDSRQLAQTSHNDLALQQLEPVLANAAPPSGKPPLSENSQETTTVLNEIVMEVLLVEEAVSSDQQSAEITAPTTGSKGSFDTSLLPPVEAESFVQFGDPSLVSQEKRLAAPSGQSEPALQTPVLDVSDDSFADGTKVPIMLHNEAVDLEKEQDMGVITEVDDTKQILEARQESHPVAGGSPLSKDVFPTAFQQDLVYDSMLATDSTAMDIDHGIGPDGTVILIEESNEPILARTDENTSNGGDHSEAKEMPGQTIETDAHQSDDDGYEDVREAASQSSSSRRPSPAQVIDLDTDEDASVSAGPSAFKGSKSPVLIGEDNLSESDEQEGSSDEAVLQEEPDLEAAAPSESSSPSLVMGVDDDVVDEEVEDEPVQRTTIKDGSLVEEVVELESLLEDEENYGKNESEAYKGTVVIGSSSVEDESDDEEITTKSNHDQSDVDDDENPSLAASDATPPPANDAMFHAVDTNTEMPGYTKRTLLISPEPSGMQEQSSPTLPVQPHETEDSNYKTLDRLLTPVATQVTQDTAQETEEMLENLVNLVAPPLKAKTRHTPSESDSVAIVEDDIVQVDTESEEEDVEIKEDISEVEEAGETEEEEEGAKGNEVIVPSKEEDIETVQSSEAEKEQDEEIERIQHKDNVDRTLKEGEVTVPEVGREMSPATAESDAERSGQEEDATPAVNRTHAPTTRADKATHTMKTRSMSYDGTSEQEEETGPEDSFSTTNPPTDGFRTALAYFSTLLSLDQHFGDTIDVIAIAISSTKPVRAKAGPRHMFTTLHLVDPSSKSLSDSFTTAQIFRLSQSVLPVINSGDAILLRDFKVQSQKRKLMLTSTGTSGWAVFSPNVEVQIRGPPVEYGAEEEKVALDLLQWWSSRDEVKRLRRATSRRPPKRHSMDYLDKRSSRDENLKPRSSKGHSKSLGPLEARHFLRDGTAYIDSSADDDHELRDGRTYTDR